MFNTTIMIKAVLWNLEVGHTEASTKLECYFKVKRAVVISAWYQRYFNRSDSSLL